MLSIGSLGKGQAAYYVGLAQEDYYLEGGEPPGKWLGQGAKDLDIEGKVNGEQLTRLFEGRHPENSKALIQNAGEPNHQPGWDLTFSAPKSVSVLWSQASPEVRQAIQEAHFAAVQAAVGYIEDNAAITRRGKGGEIKEEAHLIAATFEHGTSRAQDPQLHTHCLIMNVCTREDGTTGTIESKPLYQSKMVAGALYRAELAAQLEQRLDIEVERTGKTFEIVGVPKNVIETFSKRREEIEEVLAAKGYSSPEASAAAALSTRSVKEHLPREELLQGWQRVGAELGWGPTQAQRLLASSHSPERNAHDEIYGALNTATDRLTAQQSYFSERDFVRSVAEEAQGRGMDAGIVRTASRYYLETDENIVRLGERGGQTLYTTPAVLEEEKALLAAVDRSKNVQQAGVSELTIHGVVASRIKLSEEQGAAVRHITESGGTIRVVSGMAGTGKTSMLAAARLAWELEGFDVHGASLSGKAAKGLSDGARIESDTLHKTLYDIEGGRLRLSDRSVLVVDEAGMVGTRQMRQLVEACEQSGSRLVLVGDARQLQPIEAGGPFAEVQRQLGAAELTQIRRQRDGWARDAVTDFAAGRANEGLTAYAERGLLSIADDRQGAYQKLIDSWKTEGARAPEEQLIFTGSRLEATILNRMAQAERKKLGELEGEGIPAPEKKDTLYVGDRVLFTKKSRLYGVENGSLGDVVEVDAKKRTLTSRLDSGEQVSVPLDTYTNVQLGYAITTHKGQGATVERSFILVGGGMQDREISYVQASRARGAAMLFSDKETAGHDLYQLVRQMETSRAKEMAHFLITSTYQEIQQHDRTIHF